VRDGAAGMGRDCCNVLEETVEVGVEGGCAWTGGVELIVILGTILLVTPYLASGYKPHQYSENNGIKLN
jgi:hypothetical protein